MRIDPPVGRDPIGVRCIDGQLDNHPIRMGEVLTVHNQREPLLPGGVIRFLAPEPHISAATAPALRLDAILLLPLSPGA
jgi:hypothetical protein